MSAGLILKLADIAPDPPGVIFKSLDDLVHNPRYTLFHYAELEQPRQQSLDPANEEDFKSISRDYCVLSSPNQVSWQYRDAQKNPTLKIFHTDVVRIPRSAHELLKKFQVQNHSQGHYLNRWYLQGFTRTYVENIFKTRLGLNIPLKGESLAEHWVPAVRHYNVEIEPDVWQDRLAIFFDGFVEISMQSIENRLDAFCLYGECLKAKELGKFYLAAWKERWEEEAKGEVAQKDGGDGKSSFAANEKISLSSSESPPQKHFLPSKARGRKRRAVIRHLRIIGPKQITPIIKDGKTLASQTSRSSPSKMNHSDDGPKFSFRNLELSDEEYHRNKVPISLKVLLKQPLSPESGSSPLPHQVPTLLVQRLDDAPPITNPPKRYHVISYCNKNAPANPSRTTTPTDGSLLHFDFDHPEEEEEPPVPRLTMKDIHVADLIDEVGIVDAEFWFHKAFFSIIQVSAPVWTGELPEPSIVEYNSYWHKFSTLIYGFTEAGDVRKLPFSLGYGSEHRYPALVRRENRWGYFDVDNVCVREGRPRWRAAWRFEMNIGGDRCACSLGEVRHHITSCRYLKRENPGTANGAMTTYEEPQLPDEILSDVLNFVHQPQEVLQNVQSILHKFSPRWRENSKPPGDSTSDLIDDIAELPEDEIDRDDLRATDTERMYELGITHLMGLGVPKDVGKGIHIITQAAECGCSRARATVCSISKVYNFELAVEPGVLEQWLKEESLAGSTLALGELQTRFPETHKQVAQTLVLQLSCPVQHHPGQYRVLRCNEDVAPHFDLSNTTVLSQQLSKFDNERNKNDINAMLTYPEYRSSASDHYFIFGSLLHLASTFGFYQAVELLIDEGFDVNAQSSTEETLTPLLCALRYGHVDIAKLLINKGARCAPVCIWTAEELFCVTPTPLHYLVYIDDDRQARDLAKLIVKNGADLNFKCRTESLHIEPALEGESITPLRWAVIHQKPQLVRVLLGLGAKFAYEKYIRSPKVPTNPSTSPITKEKQGCLLLETPTTDLNILEMFYARSRIPGLPSEFSQTPLGLLVSEDDGPLRRLRKGFGDFENVREALDLCLELQPGFEDEVLWSVVRHGLLDVLKYLVGELGWSVEGKWRGCTALHTAVVYGRVECVRYLLDNGAGVTVVTDKRGLTVLHILMLVPRHFAIDQEIFELLTKERMEIDVDAREKVDGLTAVHIAIRNRKLEMVKRLLNLGANPEIPVNDQLPLLYQGKTGLLQYIPASELPKPFTKNLTMMGEMIIQYIQHNFYHLTYITDLLFLLLSQKPQPLRKEDLIVDKGTGLSLLHLLAVVPDREIEPWPKYVDPYAKLQPEAVEFGPKISLLQMVLLRLNPRKGEGGILDIKDNQGDTPLHYASAAKQTDHISTLLSSGATPGLKNKFGLRPVDVLAYGIFFLGGNSLKFDEPNKSWHPIVDFAPGWGEDRSRWKRLQVPREEVRRAVGLFEGVGERLGGLGEKGEVMENGWERLCFAWDFARVQGDRYTSYNDSGGRRGLEILDGGSIWKETDGDENPDQDNWKPGGEYKFKRPYVLGTVRGPEATRPGTSNQRREREEEESFERECL